MDDEDAFDAIDFEELIEDETPETDVQPDNVKKGSNHWPIGKPRGPYQATKFRKKIPKLLTDAEISSMMGTARAGTRAAMIDPEQALRKAFVKTTYLAYETLVDCLLNDVSNAATKIQAAKAIIEQAQGIKNKKSGNLNNVGITRTGLTNIQIRGVEPPTDDSNSDDGD